MRAAALVPALAAGCLIEPDPAFVDPRGGLLIAWSFATSPIDDDSGNE